MPTPETGAATTVIPIIAAGVSAIPVIVSPIVAWYLGRSTISREAATIDYLNKRLDLLDRVNRLQAQLSDGPMKDLLEAELRHYRLFLDQPPKVAATADRSAPPPTQSRIDRFFLTSPAKNTRQRVFKGLFYFFFTFAILGLLSTLALVSTPEFSFNEVFPAVLLGSAFYLALALLCRRAAK